MSTRSNNGYVFHAAHPEQEQEARIAYRRGLRNGIIEREPCLICGTDRVVGHHEDYAEPLEVVWLCYLHHNARHHGHEIDEMLVWAQRRAA